MLTKEQIQKEIEEMDSYVPIKAIEEKLGMPPTTLQKVLKGERSLPKKWEKVLAAYFVRKPEVKIVDLTKNTHEASNKTKPAPKTNFTVNTTKNANSGLNRPVRLEGEDAIDYAGRVNEWKLKNKSQQ